MKKNRTNRPPRTPRFPSGRPGSTQELTLLKIIFGARTALREFVVGTGLQVFQALLEEDRTRLCGAKHAQSRDRDHYRHGKAPGVAVLGGRKVRIDRPRVRTCDGREVELPTWAQFSQEDPLDERAVEQMLLGVSTRRYEASLEPLDGRVESTAISRSSVSRRFVAKTQSKVDEFLGRSLSAYDFPVIMLDGTHLGEHMLVVALGLDTTGKKHVLGVVEGTTESEGVCVGLMRSLIDRGLVVERARLFVIDGGKGIRKAIREVFGQWALVQRCRVHKRRNVRDHVPDQKWSWIKAAMNKAWGCATSDEAKKKLRALATQLERDHPGAAASIREGLDETATVIDFKLTGALLKSLATTNPIENLQGSLKRTTRNVKRWKGGGMVLRWGATALMGAEKSFRRVKGHKEMPSFLTALDAQVKKVRLDKQEKAA